MTTSSKKKRLDKVEIELTPKEWAIRLADTYRKYPSQHAYIEAEIISKPIYANTLDGKAWEALFKHAEERFPGTKPEDIRARNHFRQKIEAEYYTLKNLIGKVNDIISAKAETAGLKAALKLSTLHTVILQDAFGRTAKKAAEWIEEVKAVDENDEDNRQVMLDELAAYTNVYFGETFTDSLPINENVRIRFPTVIEEWVKDTAGLITDVLTHEAAVKVVEKKYFDGHPILFLDVENRLKETVQTIEDGVGTFNQYLKTRSELFKAQWDDEEEREGIASAIPGEREGLLTINIANIRSNAIRIAMTEGLAGRWIKDVKTIARIEMGQKYGENIDSIWPSLVGIDQ